MVHYMDSEHSGSLWTDKLIIRQNNHRTGGGVGFIGRRFDFVNGCKIAERPEPTVCSPHSPRTPHLHLRRWRDTMERHLDFLLVQICSYDAVMEAEPHDSQTAESRRTECVTVNKHIRAHLSAPSSPSVYSHITTPRWGPRRSTKDLLEIRIKLLLCVCSSTYRPLTSAHGCTVNKPAIHKYQQLFNGTACSTQHGWF